MTPPPPATVKLSPIFHGLSSIATAGGASVRLDWKPAVDGETAQNMLRYRVFVSSTPGGQNFSTPTLTTAPGVSSVILSSGDTPLIAVGSRAYYVVRSLDGDGNSDENKVELTTIPVLSANVAFVDDTAGGSGTVGNPTDPYPTIQQAVNALTSGGAVLVSASAGGSTYQESLSLTSSGVTSVGIYGGFPRFAAGAGGSSTLAARDRVGHPTTISGMGISLPNGALVYVANGYRPVFLDGFELADVSGYAVRGVDVDLQVSCNVIHDGAEILVDAPSTAPVVVEQGGPASEIRIVGNSMTDSSSNYACDIGGLISLAYIQNNDIENYDEGVYLGGFTVGALVIPTIGGTDIDISDNRFISISSYGVDTVFDPESTTNGSTLTMAVNRNEIRNIDDDFANIDEFGDVGNNGSAHLTMRNNLMVGVSDDLVDLIIQGNNPTPIGRNVTADISDNTLLNSNDDGIDCEMEPSQNATSTLNVAGNLISNCESYPLDIYDTAPSGTDLGNGAEMIVNVQDNVHPGGGEAWYMDAGVAPQGRTVLSVTGNTTLTPADAYGFDMDFGYRLGSSSTPAMTEPDGVVGVLVFNNEVHGSDETAAYMYDDRGSNGSALYGLISNNIMGFTGDPSYNGLELYAEDQGDTSWLVQRNFFGVGGQDDEPGLTIYTSGSTTGQIRLLNNVFAFNSGPGIQIDDTGTRPQIINDTVAFNDQNDSEPSINAIQCYIHNCIVSHTGYVEDIPSDTWASYSLLREQSPATSGYNNLTGEPLYANSGAGFLTTPVEVATVIQDIFALAPQSPAVDAGDPDSIYNDTDGTRNDMGAYGGPGAGTMGVLTPGAAFPFVYIGMSPKPELASGEGLPYVDDTLYFIVSHPVDASTIAGNVTITSNGAAVAGTFGTAYNGNAITFEPSTTLDANGSRILTITLGTGLKDTDGKALAYRSSFRIGVIQQDASATPETEPNNDTMTAQSLGIGPGRGTAYLASTFASNTDVDVYSFTADAGRRLMATVGYRRINSGNPGNALLELLDSTGMVIATGTPTFMSDPYLDYTLPAAGTYYLRVMNPGATGGEQYAVQVQTD